MLITRGNLAKADVTQSAIQFVEILRLSSLKISSLDSTYENAKSFQRRHVATTKVESPQSNDVV